jgi:membrane-bound metal-dependent hydrolase YbcI (DUF457 family)
MPSPLTHCLLPAACAVSTARSLLSLEKKEWARFVLVCFFLANAPDLDLIPAILYPSRYYDIHREWGHNIFAVLLWTTIGARLLRGWVSPAFRDWKGWVFSAGLVFSHVLLDSCAVVVTKEGGVPLLWPLSDWSWNTPIPCFGSYHPVKASHPLLSLLLTPGFWFEVVSRELTIVVGGATLWYLALRLISSRRTRRTSYPVLPAEPR